MSVAAAEPSDLSAQELPIWERPAARPWMFLALAGLFAMQVSVNWTVAEDSVAYLSIARSIFHGQTPTRLGNLHLMYPPGFPAILAPAYLQGEHPFLAVMLIHFSCAVLMMSNVYLWVRRLAPRSAMLLTALIMINATVWLQYRRPLSEFVFTTVLMCTVNLIHQLWRDETPARWWGWALASAASLALLAEIRPIGIHVAVGTGLAAIRMVMLGKWSWKRAIATTLIVGVPPSIILGITLVHERKMAALSQATNYLGFFHSEDTLLQRMIEGVRLRIFEIGRIVLPGMLRAYDKQPKLLSPNLFLYGAVTAGVVWSWWRLVRREVDVLAWTLPAYVGMYIVWPFDQGTRYSMPLIALWMFLAWEIFHRWAPATRTRLFSVLLLIHGGVAMGYWAMEDVPRSAHWAKHWQPAKELAAEIQADYRPVFATVEVDDFWMLLAYELDRPVRIEPMVAGVPEGFDWLVRTEKSPPAPSDFVTVSHHGDYTLYRRTLSTAAIPDKSASEKMAK